MSIDQTGWSDFKKKLHKVFLFNELSGSEDGAYKIAHAGTSKSGYSFGINQMDLAGNAHARTTLESVMTKAKTTAADKTTVEKYWLLKGDKTKLSTLSKILDKALSSTEGKKVVDKAYGEELDKIIKHIDAIIEAVPNVNDKTKLKTDVYKLFLCDYHNQYHLSTGGKMHKFLKSQKGALSWNKLIKSYSQTAYNIKRPKDGKRRSTQVVNQSGDAQKTSLLATINSIFTGGTPATIQEEPQGRPSVITTPIQGKDIDSLLSTSLSSLGGHYPVGKKGFWHGGIHLEANKADLKQMEWGQPITAIADGKVIAMRLSKDPIPFHTAANDEDKAPELPYSDSFVLLEHEYHSPFCTTPTPKKGEEEKAKECLAAKKDGDLGCGCFSYYSLYMHLLPKNRYLDHNTNIPAIIQQHKKVVKYTEKITKGLNVRAVEGTTKGAKIDAIPLGHIVTPVLDADLSDPEKENTHWAKGTSYKKYTYKDSSGTETSGYLYDKGSRIQAVGTTGNYFIAVTEDAVDKAYQKEGLWVLSSAYKHGKNKVVGIIENGSDIAYANAPKQAKWYGTLKADHPMVKDFGKTLFIRHNNKTAFTEENIFKLKDGDYDKVLSGKPLNDTLGKNLTVSKGDSLGYPGLFAGSNYGSNTRLFHFEVFTGKDLSFLQDPMKEAKWCKDKQIILPEGLEIMEDNKVSGSFFKEDVVEILKTEGNYKQIKLKEIHRSITSENSYFGLRYKDGKTSDIPCIISAGKYKKLIKDQDFDEYPFSITDEDLKTKSAKNSEGKSRAVSGFAVLFTGEKYSRKFTFSEITTLKDKIAASEAVWVKGSTVPTDGILTQTLSNFFKINPEKVKAKVTQSSYIINSSEKKTDKEGTWVKVEEGKVKFPQDESKLEEITPYSWAGFKILSEAGSNAKDGFCDFGEAQLQLVANPSAKESGLTLDQLQEQQKSIIANTPSEWKHSDAKWTRIEEFLKPIAATAGPDNTLSEDVKKQMKQLTWMDQISLPNFPKEEDIHKFHPTAFIKQIDTMCKSSVSSETLLEYKLLCKVVYTITNGEVEANGFASIGYCLLNRIGKAEFKDCKTLAEVVQKLNLGELKTDFGPKTEILQDAIRGLFLGKSPIELSEDYLFFHKKGKQEETPLDFEELTSYGSPEAKIEGEAIDGWVFYKYVDKPKCFASVLCVKFFSLDPDSISGDEKPTKSEKPLGETLGFLNDDNAHIPYSFYGPDWQGKDIKVFYRFNIEHSDFDKAKKHLSWKLDYQKDEHKPNSDSCVTIDSEEKSVSFRIPDNSLEYVLRLVPILDGKDLEAISVSIELPPYLLFNGECLKIFGRKGQLIQWSTQAFPTANFADSIPANSSEVSFSLFRDTTHSNGRIPEGTWSMAWDDTKKHLMLSNPELEKESGQSNFALVSGDEFWASSGWWDKSDINNGSIVLDGNIDDEREQFKQLLIDNKINKIDVVVTYTPRTYKARYMKSSGGWEDLKQKSSNDNERVTHLQEDLYRMGYWVTSPHSIPEYSQPMKYDGAFGLGLESAIKWFQYEYGKENSLELTGYLDEKTADAIVATFNTSDNWKDDVFQRKGKTFDNGKTLYQLPPHPKHAYRAYPVNSTDPAVDTQNTLFHANPANKDFFRKAHGSMQWGTKEMLQSLTTLAESWIAAGNKDRVEIADITAFCYGKTSRHTTHIDGTGVDIRTNTAGKMNSSSYKYSKENSVKFLLLAEKASFGRAYFMCPHVTQEIKTSLINSEHFNIVVKQCSPHQHHFHLDLGDHSHKNGNFNSSSACFCKSCTIKSSCSSIHKKN